MEMFELFPQQYTVVMIFPCLSTESFIVSKVIFLNFSKQFKKLEKIVLKKLGLGQGCACCFPPKLKGLGKLAGLVGP